MSQTILITGSNSGFGLLAVNTFLDAGYKIIASMRDPEGRNKLVADEFKANGATVVDIDVTNDSSVESGINAALASTDKIDVVINNAGTGVIGFQEAFAIDDWKKIFEINLFGVQRINRAILPHMRKQGSGLLIHVSSLLGRFVLPYLGPYNASKYALEALADNYRVELSGFGIESVLIEPGGFGTDFMNRVIQASDSDRTGSYGEISQAPEQFMASFAQSFEGENAPDPQMVADAMLKVIESPRGERPFRTVVDGLGMGEPIEHINKASDQATHGLYSAIGMDGMLKIKK